MHYSSFSLANGLRIIYIPSNNPVTYCGFAVDAGTRDERATEYGLAHFVEHNLFKGTRKRKARHILNRMEVVGGELNAYTNKEETVLYAVCLTGDTERAVELLSDLVFHSQFPASEVEKEREVVIDEINLYEDTPSDLIFDEFENLLFENHELGHNILGDVDSLTGLTSDVCRSFSDRFYQPDRMVFFLSGSFPENKLKRLVDKYMTVEGRSVNTNYQRKAPRIIPARELSVDRNLHQSHVIAGKRVCSVFDDQRIALQLLNNILGGPGMNNRLNVELREKRGLVYTVESGLNFYSDCGVFSVYFGCGHDDRGKCLELVHRELKKLMENKLTGTQITAAIKQWKGQTGISSNHYENLTLGMGKRYLRFNHCESLEETYRKVDSLTAEQLLSTANEFFDAKELFTLYYY
ncbi:MAG: insulinase family protein [Dysgonamonadaceae bacterium]|jgi:predicted Zn-dependent peptidase|nr:insulinase family protein [Dysgonamonadaceae bacterium]